MTTLVERETPVAETEDVLNLPMPTRPLGHFGWNASHVTLGGVKWDVKCSDAEAVALVNRARELGINTFDTAHLYGGGESERKLGLALEGCRQSVWVNTKSGDRSYDGAMREIETSLKRLRTDYMDLFFVHSMDTEEHYRQIMAPNSVLKAAEEMKAAGHIRHVGVSGHWVRNVMARIIQEYPFEAVLFPIGLFNYAYQYTFTDTVLPIAKQRGMATLGMKVYGAGRIKQARSLEPYLRFALHQGVDTAVIGCDSIAQLEQTVRIVKSQPEPLPDSEAQALFPEALDITQEWDEHEFSWTQGYVRPSLR